MRYKRGLLLLAVCACILVFKVHQQKNSVNPSEVTRLTGRRNIQIFPRNENFSTGTGAPPKYKLQVDDGGVRGFWEQLPSGASATTAWGGASATTAWGGASTTTAWGGAQEEYLQTAAAGDRERVFAERRDFLKKTCERNMERLSFGGMAEVPLGSFRWLKKRDMVVCINAKVGSSTWVKYLLREGFPQDLGHDGIAFRRRGIDVLVPENNSSTEATLQQLRDSTKIVSVRHPFARLASAYKNKFEPCLTQSRCQGQMLMADWKSIVSFKAFAEHIIKKFPVPESPDTRTRLKFNWHWRPYYSTCGVCDVDFDYIVKMETWNEDVGYLLKKLGFAANDTIHWNSTNSTYVKDDYFEELPRSMILRLYEIYRPDFEMFEYTIDEYLN